MSQSVGIEGRGGSEGLRRARAPSSTPASLSQRSAGSPWPRGGDSSGENARPPESAHSPSRFRASLGCTCFRTRRPDAAAEPPGGLSGLRRALHGVEVLGGEEAGFRALLIDRLTLAGSRPACWPGPSCLQEAMLGGLEPALEGSCGSAGRSVVLSRGTGCRARSAHKPSPSSLPAPAHQPHLESHSAACCWHPHLGPLILQSRDQVTLRTNLRTLLAPRAT